MTDRVAGMREALAGAGIGILVGLLVGLSTAEVVGGVIAALTALLAAFFGLRESSGESSGIGAGDARAWRLAGFGMAGSLALVLGLWMRANDALGQDPAVLVEDFVGAGFDSTTARSLVAYELLGVRPEGMELVRENLAAGRRGVLFAGDAASECSNLRESRYRDPGAWAAAARTSADPGWSALGAAVSGAGSAVQEEVMRAAWAMVCEA